MKGEAMSEPSEAVINEATRLLQECARQIDAMIKATRDGGSVAMVESDSDGGPAFPVVRMPLDPDTILNRPGMSLRDWLAGMALQGILAADSETQSIGFDAAATMAYEHADAMLKARVTAKPTP